MLLIRVKTNSCVASLLSTHLSQFFFKQIPGNVNLWKRMVYGIHEHRSSTNTEKSIVNGFKTLC